jgi:hypothetical protein
VGQLINDFSSYPLWKKVLIIAGFPLILLFLFLRGASTVSALFNSAARERTDSDSAKLEEKIQATAGEVAKEQGKVDQLQESKNEAIKAQDTTDATDFYNNRFKPDGK